MLYLTNQRLIYKPMFLYVWWPTLDWRFEEIESIGDDKRPWTLAFFFPLYEWFRRPFYLSAKGDEHYFYTTRNEEWLTELAKVTGLAPRRHNA